MSNNKDNNDKPSFLDHAKASSSQQPNDSADSAAQKPEPISDKPSLFDLAKQSSKQESSPQEEPKPKQPSEENTQEGDDLEFPWMDNNSTEEEQVKEEETPQEEEATQAPFQEDEASKTSQEEITGQSIESILQSNSQNQPFTQESETNKEEPAEENIPKSGTNESETMDMLFNKQEPNGNEEPEETANESSFLKDIIGDSKNKDEDAVFKAYAPFDYLDEDPFKDLQEDNKPKIKLNKQAIILIIALLLAGGFFIFDTFFKREIDTSSRRRKAPRKERRRALEAETELLPLWGVTQQQSKDWIADVKLIKASFSAAGRSDPFAVPQSVIDDLRKAIEAEIEADKPPDVFRRTAYRASLVGVLTSEEDTLALVNFRAAVFDVIDGTTKPKIIKLAIKAIGKAKDDSLEVFEEDFIGPWRVQKIETGRESANESRMIIERDGDEKELRMGVPVDLGIFDEEGELAIFKDGEEEDSKTSRIRRRR